MDAGAANATGQDSASGHSLNKACESCRNSKLRCIVESDAQDNGCKRCLATGRTCVFKAPRIRQRRKTHVDTRVATLERQLRSLKIQLDLARRWKVEQSVDVLSQNIDTSTRTTSGDSSAVPVRFEPPVTPASWPKKSTLSIQELEQPTAGSSVKVTSELNQNLNGEPGSVTSDVVARNFISWPAAKHLVELYLSELAPKYPFVTLPSYSSASHLRWQRPATFLAIITAASGMAEPEVNAVLTRELLTLVARRAILDGEHTLDLAQAIVVLTIWHSTLDRFNSLRHYQLAHLAATFASDLDSERQNRQTKSERCSDEDVECIRTVLSIYMMCSGSSITSGRPKMLQFADSYIERNLSVLGSREDDADQWFIAWVMLQHLAEKIAIVLFPGGIPLDVNLIQHQQLVAELCQKLDSWRTNLSFELEGGLSIHYHYVRSMVLSVSLYVDHCLSNFRPPFHVQPVQAILPPSPALTPFLARTVMSLVDTVHAGLDAFLCFDDCGLQLAPFIYYIRTAHPLTVLLTLDIAVRRPANDLAKIIDSGMLKVEYYLRAFKAILSSARDDRGRQNPAKFLIIVERMEAWWRSQIDTDIRSPHYSQRLTVLVSDRVQDMRHSADDARRSALSERVRPDHLAPSPGATETSVGHQNSGQSLTGGLQISAPSDDFEQMLANDWIFDMSQEPLNLFASDIDWIHFDNQED